VPGACGAVRLRDLVWAGQAARAGGPQPARNRASQSSWRCQSCGRCRVRWPRPCRAIRAATSIRSARMVAPRALPWKAEARHPAARVRLCAIAARVSQVALAAKRPEVISSR
jgi:heterodisulfide reductase subunit C